MYCVGLVAFASVVVFAVYAGSGTFGRISYENVISSSTSALETLLPLEKKASHVDVPDAVRAIYMTSCTATRRDLRDRLVALVDETELNSIVIDIKTYDGRISFPVENPVLVPAQGGSCFVPDMKEFLEELHEKNIYVIGRIAVFQDVFMVKEKPQLAVKKDTDRTAVWKDHKGISWIDAGAMEHWEYIKTLAEESYKAGFDELNFDYIRFPSDGNMKDIYYPVSEGKKKSDVIESFFEYLHGALDHTDAYLSADLFGMVTTNTDDLNIGQVLEKALPYFDYIAPMVYPSHYPFNFHNLGDPNKDPLESCTTLWRQLFLVRGHRVLSYKQNRGHVLLLQHHLCIQKNHLIKTNFVHGFRTIITLCLIHQKWYERRYKRPMMLDLIHGCFGMLQTAIREALSKLSRGAIVY